MILGLIEHNKGVLNDTSLEMLTLAQALATALDCPLQAVVIGDNGKDVVAKLPFVTTTHLLTHGRLGEYAPQAWAEGLRQLIETTQPQVVCAIGSERGNETMAHLAAKLNAPFAANCTQVTPDGEHFLVTRIRWGGSLLEEANLAGTPKLFTVASHTILASEAPTTGSVDIQTHAITLSEADLAVQVVRYELPEGDGVSLTDARVVVSGGRGVGGSAGFAVLDELAVLVAGAVGCSRAVTNAGWRSHNEQVGQTGARVAPDLYIACGISGAIQHMAGCKGSKKVLAINIDPQAAILAKADYAIIGDLHEVLPAISTVIRNKNMTG